MNLKSTLVIIISIVALLAVLFLGISGFARPKQPFDDSPVRISWAKDPHPRDVVVLFVHGIYSSADEAFDTAQKSNWVSSIAEGDRFQSYYVGVVDYRSQTGSENPSLPGVSSRLAAYLDKEFSETRQIIFVAHSLGGVVCRSALAKSKIANRPDQHVLLVTLSSPFNGARVADIGNNLTGSLSGPQLRDLRTDSSVLTEIDGHWGKFKTDMGSRLRELAVYETEPIGKSSVVVVPQASATLNVEPINTMPALGFDHSTICKSASVNSPHHERVLAMISEEHAVKTYVGDAVHRVRGHLLRPLGTITRVEPGAIIELEPGAQWEVRGRIEAKGTTRKPIVIRGTDPSAASAGVLLLGSGTKGSSFKHVKFSNLRGVLVRKPGEPSPSVVPVPTLSEIYGDDSIYAAGHATKPTPNRTHGGALVLAQTSEVTLADCAFEDNAAFQGGGLSVLASSRVSLYGCAFRRNWSGFGGGALFAQGSQLSILDGCRFESNTTGARPPAFTSDPLRPENNSGSGGAVYLGYACGSCEVRGAVFENNRASGDGGSLYVRQTHAHPQLACHPHLIIDECEIKRSAAGAEGVGICVSERARVQIGILRLEPELPAQICDDTVSSCDLDKAASLIVKEQPVAVATVLSRRRSASVP